jgi:hypothetical protein
VGDVIRTLVHCRFDSSIVLTYFVDLCHFPGVKVTKPVTLEMPLPIKLIDFTDMTRVVYSHGTEDDIHFVFG